MVQDKQRQTENAFDVENTQHKASFRQVDNPYDSSSSTIRNNVQWKDQNGDLLHIGRGGKITKIGDIFYWVGHKPSDPGLWVRRIFSLCSLLLIIVCRSNQSSYILGKWRRYLPLYVL